MHGIKKELKKFQEAYDKTIDITEGLPYRQKDVLKMVEFYTNSRYLNGQKDSQGREKPFFNIVNANTDVSVVATDIDTKDIVISSDDKDSYNKTFLLTKELQRWMKKVNFAKFLNEAGETRARYGGVLVKRVKKKDHNNVEVVQWRNVLTDQADIINNPIVEKHWMTPVELDEKRDAWDNIDEAIKLAEDEGKVLVYEITGKLKSDYLDTDTDDTYTYQEQFVILGGQKGCIELYKDKLDKPKYKYLSWKDRNGRALGVGVVEEGEEAQVWTNDSVIREKEALELASKTILKTNSKKVGNNVLTERDNGDIIELEPNADINVMNLMNNAMPELEGVMQKWFQQYERATSTFEAQRGETPPSGTPFRLQALVQQQSGSTFDYKREQMGIFLNEIFKDWILPDLVKELKKEHTLVENFTADELKRIDNAFVEHQAKKDILKDFLEGNVTIRDFNALVEERKEILRQDLKKNKSRRFIEIPKDYFSGIELEVQLATTGEQTNKMAMMQSLSTILQMVLQTQGMVLQDPKLNKIFNRIIELSGAMSPVELEEEDVETTIPGQTDAAGVAGVPSAGVGPEGIADPSQQPAVA